MGLFSEDGGFVQRLCSSEKTLKQLMKGDFHEQHLPVRDDFSGRSEETKCGRKIMEKQQGSKLGY